MPLIVPRRKKDIGNTIAQVMREYHNTGKIGDILPKSLGHAERIATAIAYRLYREKKKRNG